MKLKIFFSILLFILIFSGCKGEISTTIRFDKNLLYSISLEKMDKELYYGADEVIIIDDEDGYIVESYYLDNKKVIYRVYYDCCSYKVIYIQKEITNPYCYLGCEDYYFLEEEYIYL